MMHRNKTLMTLITAFVVCSSVASGVARAAPSTSRYTARTIENMNDGDPDNDGKTLPFTYITQVWNYYSEGALKSVNNIVGSTYNYSKEEFEKAFSTYKKELLGKVDYDTTDELFTEPDEDNVSANRLIMHVKNYKRSTPTNYTDKQLKELGLLNSESEDATNTVSLDDVTTSELTSALSYFIEKDYYTVPSTTVFRYAKPGESGTKMVQKRKIGTEARNWYYAVSDEDVFDIDESDAAYRTPLNKSDMIMLLSKAFCGVKSSRPLVFSDYSERNGILWSYKDPTAMIADNGKSYSKNLSSGSPELADTYYGKNIDDDGDIRYFGAQFVGDYFVYTSPNVYELYLSEALDDGIISLSDLDTASLFRQDYRARSLGDWGVMQIAQDKNIVQGVLGYSTNVKVSEDGFAFDECEPTYFGDKEEMTMMEALQIVEAYMRMRDDNMSDVEESAVRYKLGLSVLSALNKDDMSTITYLVAKGVLDSSESSLLSLLYDKATIARMYPILYRAVNKNARYDFSTIQLTDSETVWAAEGFGENTFEVYSGTLQPIHITDEEASEKKKVRKDNTKADYLESVEKLFDGVESVKDRTLGWISTGVNTVRARLPGWVQDKIPILEVPRDDSDRVITANAASNVAVYTVVKYFDKQYVYQYGTGGDTIGQMAQDNKLAEGITSIEETKYEVNNKEIDVYKVTFEVEATSLKEAINSVDHKISFSVEMDQTSTVISGVTQLQFGDDGSGNSTNAVSMISQKAVKQAFSKIAVLEDKILMNTDTGAMAYFSDTYNFALIGNQIINSSYKVIYNTSDGEVYYDLNVLITLMSKAMLDIVGTQTNICLTDLYNEETIKLGTSSMDASDIEVNAQIVMAYADDGKDPNDSGEGFLRIADNTKKGKGEEQRTMLKLNTITNGMSVLSKSFSTKYGDQVFSGTVLVDFSYVVPSIDKFDKWFLEELDNKEYTYQDALKVLVTPPDEIEEVSTQYSEDTKSALQVWWESNYGMSNALCNYMYGTTGKTYISSGYLVPSVTVLMDNVGNSTFSEWCKSKQGGNSERETRNKVLKHVFNDKVLFADDYIKYNGDSQAVFWETFYGYGMRNYSYPVLKDYSSEVSDLARYTRTFEIYEQPSDKQIKKNSTGKKSIDQKIKTYGTRYFVSDCGSVYENIPDIQYYWEGNYLDRFSVVYTMKNNKKTVYSAAINTRNIDYVNPSKFDSVIWNGGSYFYAGDCSVGNSTGNSRRYITISPKSVFTTSTSSTGMVTASGTRLGVLALRVVKSGSHYEIAYRSSGKMYAIDSKGFRDQYLNRWKTITGNENVKKVFITNEGFKKLFDTSQMTGKLFLSPGNSADVAKQMFKGALGGGAYLYTDIGSISAAGFQGSIYKWTGSECQRVTSKKELASLAKNETKIYALPRYLFPKDKHYFFKNSAGNTELCQGAVSKSLHYQNLDYSSLNSQLIESYLSDQTGIRTIGSLSNGMTVRIGDIVWVKKGKDIWQSKAVKNKKIISAVTSSKSVDLSKQTAQLFGTTFVESNGVQYSLEAYVSDLSIGTSIGNKSQRKKGIIYIKNDGDTVPLVYKNGKSHKVTSKTKANYISLQCKFDESLLVRPLDSKGSSWIMVQRANLGMLSSDQYPFFDDDASWVRKGKTYNDVTVSDYSPSAAFLAAKNAFMQEYEKAVLGDTWSLFKLILISLMSYLLVMSWFAYGVLTLGVGRRGFEVLAMKDQSGHMHGFDLIKISTLGLYNLNESPTLARCTIISFVCCIGLLIVFVAL